MHRLALLAGLLVASCTHAAGSEPGAEVRLRLGGATVKTAGWLVGVDLTLPRVALRRGLFTRIDVDTWGAPLAGWDSRTGGRSACVCQLVDGIMGYYGAGVGFTRFRERGSTYESPSIKLVSGMRLLGVGFESNLHIGKLSLWTGVARFRF